MPGLLSQLDALRQRLTVIPSQARNGGHGDDKSLVQILRKVCAVAREADANNVPDLTNIVDKAQKILDKGINLAYNSPAGYYDFLPSFAHADESAPVVKDSLAMSIDEQFCAIFFRSQISSRSSCLALCGAGGWKNRDPVIHYYLLNTDNPLEGGGSFDPGLGGIANALALDEDRKLIFVGDKDRVKSFAWPQNPSDVHPLDDLPGVHTLQTSSHHGPISVLSNGRIVRAGKGSALMWIINDLETHGPNYVIIGEGEDYADDCLRDNDDGDAIELSSGSRAHEKIFFAVKTLKPGV
ncbi:uncharacterized protein FIBRA_00799 [Fibroporia radiculosa]|uniref:Uncharacterized protein n=1 Tax=Fibroporia radiculosa TaxID=599839 RepID=J4H0R2_9APHY|nr:uncharacterized protein FIBRA_00799 [Fibroporia radiculosa]CCL98794.1 predicted protein [Fibroporia radiculosa]